MDSSLLCVVPWTIVGVSSYFVFVVKIHVDQANTAEIHANGQVSQDRSFIHLKQTEGDGYGIKEILYHNSSCFT